MTYVTNFQPDNKIKTCISKKLKKPGTNRKSKE